MGRHSPTPPGPPFPGGPGNSPHILNPGETVSVPGTFLGMRLKQFPGVNWPSNATAACPYLNAVRMQVLSDVFITIVPAGEVGDPPNAAEWTALLSWLENFAYCMGEQCGRHNECTQKERGQCSD
jgi:hypothetical protein